MKYAFIDFQNTDNTTKTLLGFEIDWLKLHGFLKDRWNCDKVFVYAGVDEGDEDAVSLMNELREAGCVVRDKTVFAYKNKDKEINITCPICGEEFTHYIKTGYSRKSNCDVDLTVDAVNTANPEDVFYIFTGDGDFEYLIREVNSKGVKVRVVSSARRIMSGPRYFTSRLSTKLRKLFSENSEQVDFIEINNIKARIIKE